MYKLLTFSARSVLHFVISFIFFLQIVQTFTKKDFNLYLNGGDLFYLHRHQTDGLIFIDVEHIYLIFYTQAVHI